MAAAKPRNVPVRVLRRIALWVRRLVIGITDPIVQCRLNQRPILVPLSHDLPLILAASPHYAQNLVRLVDVVAGQRVSATFVDIGANIGDTVVLIRATTEVAALAIEGDGRYVPLLIANLDGIPEVEVETSYVSSNLTSSAVRVARAHGTARLMPSEIETPIVTRPLAEILKDHPRFTMAAVVKIDTDGADSAIISGNARWFAKAKPVVFFEYDAHLAAELGDQEPWRALGVLAEAGYNNAIVYVNTGELLTEVPVSNLAVWRDLASYTRSAGRRHYFDIAAFPAEDVDLFKRFLSSERSRFERAAKGDTSKGLRHPAQLPSS